MGILPEHAGDLAQPRKKPAVAGALLPSIPDSPPVEDHQEEVIEARRLYAQMQSVLNSIGAHLVGPKPKVAYLAENHISNDHKSPPTYSVLCRTGTKDTLGHQVHVSIGVQEFADGSKKPYVFELGSDKWEYTTPYTVDEDRAGNFMFPEGTMFSYALGGTYYNRIPTTQGYVQYMTTTNSIPEVYDPDPEKVMQNFPEIIKMYTIALEVLQETAALIATQSSQP